MIEQDPRLNVFLTDPREVFHSVEHRQQIWREDPFDVDTVHEEARAGFRRLLSQATTPPGIDSGRILLLLGDSGSGKTHLMRSFRNHVHVNGLGFVGYMQMTTGSLSYGRYILSNLIDSLDQPYYESMGTTSGLLRLSTAIASRCGDPKTIEALLNREGLEPDDVIDLVGRAADRLIAQTRYADLDLDLVRALLFLQRNDPGLRSRVVKYLRCEDLSERDRKLLDLTPKHTDDHAAQLIEQIGRMIWAFDSRSLVLCVDQLEDMYNLEGAEAPFRRAMAALCAVADHVPSSIIVISCLKDYYTKLRPRLTRSTLDRIENDPEPIRLVSERSLVEVEMIIRQRLGYLYETSRAKLSPESNGDPLYPMPRAFIEQLSKLRVRDVLDECRGFRDRCKEAGGIVDSIPPTFPSAGQARIERQAADIANAAKTKLEQAWNDALAAHKEELPEEDADLAEIFGWAIRACADELESGYRFEVHIEKDTILVRTFSRSNGKMALDEEILVALCNKAPQGGGLNAQIEKAAKHAGKRILALLRCGEFPNNQKTIVAQSLANILKKGGRKAVIEDTDWRTIVAFREFRKAHESWPHFVEWLKEGNYLSRLSPLMHVLDIDRLNRPGPDPEPGPGGPSAPPAKPPPPPAPAEAAQHSGAEPTPRPPGRDDPPPVKTGGVHPPPAQGKPPVDSAGPLVIGTTGELITHPVTLDLETLSAHSAFLGSTGSGKTTLALTIVEQLLLRGIPAILVDRKGDLCVYGRGASWEQGLTDPAQIARRRALRERLDVALFTPGHPEGRQLSISLVPHGLSALKDFDREQAALYAAQALGDALGYKHMRKDKSLRAILVQAFQILAHVEPDKLDLEMLIEFIANEDPALVVAMGWLDMKLCKTLVQDLETLKLSSSDILSPTSEKVDADLLLGLGPHARPGRTRLSVINTRFLGDNARILFWVSQLLLSLTRWVARAPSPRLQAVVLFDEADVYLPAVGQPATKAPMENLLRRARSGGLGLMLATQSPGDLDYKCRDNIRSWFVGRVTQSVAIDKMKPLLSDARVNFAARIPGQKVGEFHMLQDGHSTGFRGRTACLRAEQVPEDEILALAARRRGIR